MSSVSRIPLLLASVSYGIANAMMLEGPKPTLPRLANEHGWTPKPTQAALGPLGSMSESALFGKWKRQNPGSICGYLDGFLTSSISCTGSSVCATNSMNNALACCDGGAIDQCTIPYACVASTDIFYDCDDDCYTDGHTLKCTANGLGECVTLSYNYPGMVVTGVACGPSASVAQVEVTYSAVAPAAMQNTDDSDGSNVGPIAGGVVGGVVFIAIVIGAIVFFLRRKKKKQGEKEPTHTEFYNTGGDKSSPQPNSSVSQAAYDPGHLQPQYGYSSPPSRGPQSSPPPQPSHSPPIGGYYAPMQQQRQSSFPAPSPQPQQYYTPQQSSQQQYFESRPENFRTPSNQAVYSYEQPSAQGGSGGYGVAAGAVGVAAAGAGALGIANAYNSRDRPSSPPNEEGTASNASLYAQPQTPQPQYYQPYSSQAQPAQPYSQAPSQQQQYSPPPQQQQAYPSPPQQPEAQAPPQNWNYAGPATAAAATTTAVDAGVAAGASSETSRGEPQALAATQPHRSFSYESQASRHFTPSPERPPAQTLQSFASTAYATPPASTSAVTTPTPQPHHAHEPSWDSGHSDTPTPPAGPSQTDIARNQFYAAAAANSGARERDEVAAARHLSASPPQASFSVDRGHFAASDTALPLPSETGAATAATETAAPAPAPVEAAGTRVEGAGGQTQVSGVAHEADSAPVMTGPDGRPVYEM